MEQGASGKKATAKRSKKEMPLTIKNFFFTILQNLIILNLSIDM